VQVDIEIELAEVPAEFRAEIGDSVKVCIESSLRAALLAGRAGKTFADFGLESAITRQNDSANLLYTFAKLYPEGITICKGVMGENVLLPHN
jgi:hypothetical protein